MYNNSISNDNNEISCTIEETNRIRAQLGLKPLNTGKKETQETIAFKNYQEKKKKDEKQLNIMRIQRKIEKAKKKRLLNEKLKGESLGDINDDDEQRQSESEGESKSSSDKVNNNNIISINKMLF